MTTPPERRTITIDDDENHRLHAVWSRSGKRLIVSVTTRTGIEGVELRYEQVEALINFLTETVGSAPEDR